MSMHYYPCEIYGLLIPQTLEKEFIEKYNSENETTFDDFQDMYFENVSITKYDTVLYVDVNENDAEFRIIDNNSISSELDTRYIDGGLIIPLPNQPRLIGSAYTSMEQIRVDMLNLLHKYLPSNFNYLEHIGLFSAIYWG